MVLHILYSQEFLDSQHIVDFNQKLYYTTRMRQRSETLIKIFKIIGTQYELSKYLGISRQAVCQWKVVPSEHVKKISFLTGLRCEEIRPDIFGNVEADAQTV
jgi:hypothetical protein